MKSIIFVVAIVVSISVFARPDRNIENLKVSIEKVIAAAGANVNVGIEIASLKTNEVLYEKNSKHLFVPASLTQIFTAAAALDRLGPFYQFETKVAKDAEGNLYLIGSGDPSLQEKSLEELSLQLSLLKDKEFKDLIIDQTSFDAIVNGPGWMWDEGEYYWNSPIDALLIDHSCVDVWVLPASIAKSAPSVIFRTGVEHFFVENMATTTEEKGDLEVRRTPFMRENHVEVLGSLALNSSPQHFRVPVQAPHMHAGNLFQKKLKGLGILCKGSVHIGKTPVDCEILAVHHSQPLSVVILPALKDSDNLTSNCLFKKLGQSLDGIQGTWQNGSKAVRTFLEEKAKMKIDDLVVLDGSGESRYNLASPHHFVQCLRFVSQQFSWGPEMTSAFAMSGSDGRFMKNRLSDVRGKIRAKSGAMTGVSGLAGFAETKEGEILIFAIMANGFTKKAVEMKSSLEDPICKLLANFSRK